jgi:hypothetical protein
MSLQHTVFRIKPIVRPPRQPMSWKPKNIASLEVTAKLRLVPPSFDGHAELRPCCAKTKDGSVIERLLMLDEPHGLPGRVVLVSFIGPTSPSAMIPHNLAT